MAGKKSSEDAEKTTNGAGIWPLFRLISLVMCIVCTALLFVSALDFGFIDLRYQMSMFTAPLIGLAASFASVAAVATSKCTAAHRQKIDGMLQDMKVAVALRAENVERKVEEYLGAEYARLRGENDELKASLETVKESEVEKLAEENKFLKELNSTLQSKINAASNGAMAEVEAERTEMVG